MSANLPRRARLRVRRPDRLVPGLLHGLTAEARILESRAREIFTPHRPLAAHERQYGRYEETMQVVGALNTPGLHVVLRGSAGIGKTSLMNSVVATMAAAKNMSNTVVRCDSSDTFETIVAESLAKAGIDVLRVESVVKETRKTKVDANIPHIGIGTERQYETYATYRPDARMGPAEAARYLVGQSFILAIDDTHAVPEAERHKLAVFVKHLGESGSGVKVLFAGVASSAIDLIGPGGGAALADVCLTRISSQDICDLIQSGFEMLGITIDESIPAAVADLCDGYPQLAQLLGLNCAEGVIREGRTHVVAQDLRLASVDAVRGVDRTLVHTYEHAREPTLLELVAGLPAAPFTLADLAKGGWVSPMPGWAVGESAIFRQVDTNTYEFTDPRMRSYIRIRHLLA
ncbi:hypothetical protein ACIRSS_23135 [Amycolatopsis sp. NPDC101161]|uniref:hypothetical protein n=1 Tax=Amycolatopsis sp. NPDC101161 TaxID=3363940 RepID=UPI00381AFD73